MGVPKSKQNDTKIKFISQSYDICDYTYRLTKKLPNKYKYIRDQMFNQSIELYSLLKDTNLIYPNSYDEAKDRRDNFKMSRRIIQRIGSYINLLLNLNNTNVKKKSLYHLSDKLNKLDMYLNNLIKFEKKKYKKLFPKKKKLILKVDKNNIAYCELMEDDFDDIEVLNDYRVEEHTEERYDTFFGEF